MTDKPAAKPSTDPGDNAKDKFREALERKRSQQADRSTSVHGESKVHGEHSAAGGKRTFRRKSG